MERAASDKTLKMGEGGLSIGLILVMSNIDSNLTISRRVGRDTDNFEERKYRNILGINVVARAKNSVLAELHRLIDRQSHAKVSFLNAHCANIAWEDKNLRQCLEKFMVLPDGIGVDLCSRINYGVKFPDNLNGTDFIPALLESLQEKIEVGLLGAKQEVVNRARENLAKSYPRHRFSVISHGYVSQEDQSRILIELELCRPDILLVALGNPAQEKWIARNCEPKHCTLAFGVGALFDFASKQIPRAPRMMRKLRLEWLFRLALEPGRMWRRYIVGNPVFLWRSLMQRYGSGAKGTAADDKR